VLESGKVQAIEVKKGDRVLFGKYSGDDIVIDGVKHKIVKESELLAVYEEK
jgi:chaperonin GroES